MITLDTSHLTSSAIAVLAALPESQRDGAIVRANEIARANGLTGVSGSMMQLAALMVAC